MVGWFDWVGWVVGDVCGVLVGVVVVLYYVGVEI